MPPANVKHTFMKCKLCSQLIDNMDLSAHANMHREHGDIPDKAADISVSVVNADSTTATKCSGKGADCAVQSKSDENKSFEEDVAETSISSDSSACNRMAGVGHLFASEKVNNINKDKQLFVCELCRPEQGDVSLDDYLEHLTQPQHMKNVFQWLLAGQADTISNYQVLAGKIKASNKPAGLFCEFCRKASFIVKDMASQQSHLLSEKHVNIVKKLKSDYRQLVAHFDDVAKKHKNESHGSTVTAKDVAIALNNPQDALTGDAKSNKSTKAKEKDKTTVWGLSPEHKATLPMDFRRSSSWSPVRSSSPSPRNRSPDIEVITVRGNVSPRPSSVHSSISLKARQRREEHRSSSGYKKSRSPVYRSLSHRSRRRSSSFDRRQRRSRSPRFRRSRSKGWLPDNPHYKSRSRSRERAPPSGRYPSSHRLRSKSPYRRHRDWHHGRRSRSHSAGRRSRSPNRMKSYRRSRSPDHNRRRRSRSYDYSRNVRSSSRDRYDARRTQRSPPPISHGAEAEKKRLRPRPLSPWSIDSLTFLVEKKWTNYYEKYYCSGVRDDAQSILMQKEYLQAYKGFFMDDPNFDLCYSYLLKPETLRTLLTERIDRGSPGPFELANSAPLTGSDTIEPGELVDDKRRKELRKRKWERRLGDKLSTVSRQPPLPTRDVGRQFSSHNIPQSSSRVNQTSRTVSAGVAAPAAEPSVPTPAAQAASFHSFDKLKALIREKLKIPTGTEATPSSAIDSAIEVPDLVKQALQQINTNKARETEPDGPSLAPHQASSRDLIFKDPFLGFAHNVLSGILKMTGLQDEVDSGSAPAGVRSQLYLEQRRMHESMVTPEGHLMIRMARMTLTNIERLHSKFGASHADVVAILKNLDRDVLQLIADTPMLKQ